MSSPEDPLFSDFPPVSTDEWEEVIESDLKGVDYKDKLKWRTGEGVEVLPFYRQENLEGLDRKKPLPKTNADKAANSWEIREPIFERSLETANAAARQALERGADALEIYIRIRRAEGALGGDLQGVAIQSQNDFEKLLTGIPLEDAALHFDAGMASPAFLAMLKNEAARQGVTAKAIGATLNYDPFTFMLQKGYYSKEKTAIQDDIETLAQIASDSFPGIRPLAIDAKIFHNCGAVIVQELGYALSAASEYLSLLTQRGVSADKAAACLHFSFSVGSNYFLEIAKFRAMRILWKNLINAYEGSASALKTGPYLHAETSQWNQTLYDPYSNLLRTSTEGMAAAIGGCDAITVQPFNTHYRQPDTFSKRIARNQQIIMDEEAYLGKVADPSAGSYYIEQLTDKLGKEAWKTFQEVESEGGLMKSLENGTVQAAIEKAKEKYDKAIATRSRVFVGTNRYTNPDETRKDWDSASGAGSNPLGITSLVTGDNKFQADKNTNTIDALSQALSNGAMLGDLVTLLFDYQKKEYRSLQPYRGAQAFEAIRIATENHATTPKVLLLPLGNRRMRKARASFASNFFGCAGYEIKEPVGFETMEAAIDAVNNQKPDIVVLCSSDEEYRELVPELGEQLADLPNRPITVLAGYPKDRAAEYKELGIDLFIHAKSNVLEVLTDFQQRLGILGQVEEKTNAKIDNQ